MQLTETLQRRERTWLLPATSNVPARLSRPLPSKVSCFLPAGGSRSPAGTTEKERESGGEKERGREGDFRQCVEQLPRWDIQAPKTG